MITVVTRIESHGELGWEPGMSDQEAEDRDRDAGWRHGDEAEVELVAAMHVAAGRWMPEQAADHLRRLREQAARDRALVEDFERASRRWPGGRPTSGRLLWWPGGGSG